MCVRTHARVVSHMECVLWCAIQYLQEIDYRRIVHRLHTIHARARAHTPSHTHAPPRAHSPPSHFADLSGDVHVLQHIPHRTE